MKDVLICCTDAAANGTAPAGVANRDCRMVGKAAEPVQSDPSATPLCGIADDAAFAQAIVDVDGARRVALLKFCCVVERVAGSRDVRARLGIG